MLLAVDFSGTKKRPKSCNAIVAAIACTLRACRWSGPPEMALSRPRVFGRCAAGGLIWFETGVQWDCLMTRTTGPPGIHPDTITSLRRLRDNERLIGTVVSAVEDHLTNDKKGVPPYVFENLAFQNFVFTYFKSKHCTRLLRKCLHSISDPNKNANADSRKPSTKSTRKNNKNKRYENKKYLYRVEPTESLVGAPQRLMKVPSSIEELDKMISLYEKYEKCEAGDRCASAECLHHIKALRLENKYILLQWYEDMQQKRVLLGGQPHVSFDRNSEDSFESYSSDDASIAARNSYGFPIYENLVNNTAATAAGNPYKFPIYENVRDNVADRDAFEAHVPDDVVMDAITADSSRSENNIINSGVKDPAEPYIYDDVIFDSAVGDSQGSTTDENPVNNTAAEDSARPSQMGIEDFKEQLGSVTQENPKSLTEALQRIMELASSHDTLDEMIAKCEKYQECEESKDCASPECLHRLSPRSVETDIILEWFRHTQRMRIFMAELLYMCCAHTPMPQHWKPRFVKLGPKLMGKASVFCRRAFGSRRQYQRWNFRKLVPKWAIEQVATEEG